jgi:hypothetical protein
MNIKRILSSIGIGAGAIIIGLGVQYALANWSPAPNAPPTCSDPTIPGCNAPINVGTSAQAKNGSLSLGTSVATTSIPFDVEGIGYLQALILGKNSGSNFQYLDGNQAAGKVLTSDANGNASWAPSGSGSFSPIPTIVVATPGSWTVPPGVTKIAVAVWGGGGWAGFTGSYSVLIPGFPGSHITPCAGGDGGDGGFGESVFSVVPGQAINNITIGSGGNSSSNGIGGSSSFGSLISASGGTPGYAANTTNSQCNRVPDGNSGTVTSIKPLIGPALSVGGTYLNAGKGGTTTKTGSGEGGVDILSPNDGQNGLILIAY